MKKKYKDITIPYLYFDKSKNHNIYILNDKEYTDLNKLFRKFLGFYLTYHYKVGDKEVEVHNLSEVLEALLKNKDDFKIPKKFEEEYSEQELEFILTLKKSLLKDKLFINYEGDCTFRKNDYLNRKVFRFAKDVFNKYRELNIPKKIRSKEFNCDYYVVAGEYYESIYHALDVVYDNNLYYQFGGTKKENNRSHLHSHSFDDLVSLIFASSEEFKIHTFQRQYYSKQELLFLEALSKKLKEMGFKSVSYKPDKIEYEEYGYLKDNKKYLSLIIHNLRWNKFNRDYEKKRLESHKI